MGTDMKPCISVLTLGVASLEHSLAFYGDGLVCRPKASSGASSSMVRSRSSISQAAWNLLFGGGTILRMTPACPGIRSAPPPPLSGTMFCAARMSMT